MSRALRVLACALVAAVAFGASAQSKPKAVFVVSNMANESQAFAAKQFLKYGAEFGFEVQALDAKGDTQAESQIVTNAIAQKAKAIFVNPNDINAIIPSLMKAKSAGMVVGMFSSDLPAAAQKYRDFFAGVNDTMAGEQAAAAFIKAFPNGAKIVEIGGQAGHDAQIKRHDGFNKAIKGSKIEVIDYKACTQWATAEALTIMENMITKHGKTIQGVFVHWDNGATGVIQAAKAAGLGNVFIVGVDGNRAGYVQVKNGEQSVSIAQDFVLMTKTDLGLARDVIAGKKVEKVNWVPLAVIDKDSVKTFEPPEW